MQCAARTADFRLADSWVDQRRTRKTTTSINRCWDRSLLEMLLSRCPARLPPLHRRILSMTATNIDEKANDKRRKALIFLPLAALRWREWIIIVIIITSDKNRFFLSLCPSRFAVFFSVSFCFHWYKVCFFLFSSTFSTKRYSSKKTTIENNHLRSEEIFELVVEMRAFSLSFFEQKTE